MNKKKKEYPLQLENCGGDVYLLISKGHHDPDVFAKEVLNITRTLCR